METKDTKQNYLDPLVLAKLSSMLLRARFVVEGFIAGLHQSPFRGFSLEFAQHRQYSRGDELKYLDWKIYGRSDRFYIRQYQEETNLKSYIILDASASMGYGTRGISKLQYAAYLASSLAYLMLKQQDSVGLGTFSSQLDSYIPPRANKQHLAVILEELEKVVPAGETDISCILEGLGGHIKKRGLIIFVSDLFDEPDKVIKALKYFRFQKHEVIMFHLLDPAERELPFDDLILFEDMEKHSQVVSEPDLIRREYKNLMAGFIEKYKLSCHQSGIDYCLMDTSVPLDKALSAYLAKREMMS
ncbi:MAG: DUF58 domain-containing protein [bacterium]